MRRLLLVLLTLACMVGSSGAARASYVPRNAFRVVGAVLSTTPSTLAPASWEVRVWVGGLYGQTLTLICPFDACAVFPVGQGVDFVGHAAGVPGTPWGELLIGAATAVAPGFTPREIWGVTGEVAETFVLNGLRVVKVLPGTYASAVNLICPYDACAVYEPGDGGSFQGNMAGVPGTPWSELRIVTSNPL